MSAIALFGNQSFFGVIANNPAKIASKIICTESHIPFTSFAVGGSPDEVDYSLPCFWDSLEEKDFGLSHSLATWLANWRNVELAQKLLSFSMFHANRATLDVASSYSVEDAFDMGMDADERPPRIIYAGDGYETQKPTAHIASLIVLGVLYTLQLIILILFVVYIFRNPSWTHGLDAFSIVKVIAPLDKESLARLASLQDRKSGDWQTLDEMDGLIGVEPWDEPERDGSDGGGDGVHTTQRLRVGGSGAVG
jgi:hypothetical protein